MVLAIIKYKTSKAVECDKVTATMNKYAIENIYKDIVILCKELAWGYYVHNYGSDWDDKKM